MSRAGAIARAHRHFDDGDFLADLRRRVAIPSTSQEPERAAALRAYLDDELALFLTPLGFRLQRTVEPAGRRAALPDRRAYRAALERHRSSLRAWRHRPRIRRALASGADALDADGRRRALVRARHGRQQGPALDQHRRDCCRARRARPAGVQCQTSDRNGRGSSVRRVCGSCANSTRTGC